MNAYTFNGQTGHLVRTAMVQQLEITYREIYSKVLGITPDGVIILKDGRKFKVTLTEIL